MGEIVGNLVTVDAQAFTTNGSGENVDVLLSSSILEVTPGANNDWISGFRPVNDQMGAILFLRNAHATYNLLLKYSANSSSGYRIILPTGFVTLTLAPGRGQTLFYVKGEGWYPVVHGAVS